jgi:TetR/AcrR family transcriptional regulator, cholesterol catabolism regulator
MPVPRRERRNRKPDIVRCFSELVAERGYDAVSLRDVAEALEISKGTILHHFRSKDRLLEQVHSEYMQRRLHEARSFLARLDSPADQVRALIYQLMYAEAHDRAATVAFGREIVRFASEDVMAGVRKMRDEYSALMRDAIARGIESGQFLPADPAVVTLQIFGMCNWSWTWYRPEGAWSAADIADTFTTVLLRGLCAQRPRLSPGVPELVRSTMVGVDGVDGVDRGGGGPRLRPSSGRRSR